MGTDRRLIEFFPKSMSYDEVFRYLFENACDPIYILDRRGNFVAVNNRAEELTGFKREDFIGKSFRKIIPLKSLPKAIRGFLDVTRGKEIRIELELKTAAKKTIQVEVTSRPIIVNERILGTLGIARDITEQGKMSEELKASEEKYKQLCEDARVLMLKSGLNGNIDFTNRIVEDYGFKKDDLIGKNLRKFVPKKHWLKLLNARMKVHQGNVADGEIEIITPKGRIVAEFRSSPIRVGEKVVGGLTIIRDITERKEMEKKLEEYADGLEEKVKERTLDLVKSEEKLRSIFNSSPNAITVTDLQGNIVDCNQATLEMHKYSSKHELINKGAFELIAKKDHERAMRNMKKALEQGSVKNVEFTLLTKDGHEFPADLSASSIKDPSGDPTGFVAITGDISERKRAEEEIKRYSEHLEELIEERTKKLREIERMATIGELAAMVGHDLRNPLTSIAGATYYLKMKADSKLSEKEKEMLGMIERAIDYSNKIINDLLEYSGKMKIDLSETDPKSLSEEVLRYIEVPAGITIVNENESEPRLEVDKEKVQRVFINIIKNAFDAMPNGGVLTLRSKKTESDVSFSFADTGTGMSKETLQKLWTPLFTTKAKGMGFGLPICKRIVEAHGGRISAESTIGKGTTFTATIPIEPKSEGDEKTWVNLPESLLLRAR